MAAGPSFEDAACRTTSKSVFFPERGTAQVSAQQAKAVCNGENGMPICAHREECLEMALGNKERFGIWGGKSERERAKIAKARRVEVKRQELEVEAARLRRSMAAKKAWENRRTKAVEQQGQAAKAATRSKESSGKRRGKAA